MNRGRFQGFEDNTTVTLSVSQGGYVSGPLTVSAWRFVDTGNDGDVGDLSILTYREPMISAPEHVRFTAQVNSPTGLPPRTNGDVSAAARYTSATEPGFAYDQEMHELEFVWSFGGTTGTFDKVPRLPLAWRDKAFAYGKYAAHIFETPGTHDVTCAAYRVDYDAQGGTQSVTLVARKTIPISVSPVSTYYGGDRTVLIDPNQQFPVQGYGGARTYATYQQYRQDRNYDKSTLHRVLFARNRVHLLASEQQTGGMNRSFGAYGSGARPILREATPGSMSNFWRVRASQTSSPRGFLRFEGIDFQGTWDEATETGANPNVVTLESPVNCVFFDCTFSGIGKTAFGNMVNGGTEADASFWLYDCAVTSFRDYGLQLSQSELQWIVLRGTRITRALDASCYCGGGKDGNNPRNWHGPVRIPTLKTCLIQASDFYNRSGHGNGARSQPCWRIGTDNETTGGSGIDAGKGYWNLIAYNNVCEGGAIIANTATESGSNVIHPANVVIKHNVFMADFMTGAGVGLARGGTSFVENMMLWPDIERLRWNGTDALATGSTSYERGRMLSDTSASNTDNPENRQFPMRIIGNIEIDYKAPIDSYEVLKTWDFSSFQGFNEVRDNTTFYPGYSPPDVSAGPFEFAFSIPSYNTYGARFLNETTGQYEVFTQGPQGGSYLTPGGAVDVLRPQGSAGATGAASGAMGRTDLLGNLRPGDAAATPLESL